MKDKIEKILYEHSETIGLYEGDVMTCVGENEFDDVVDEIVKAIIISHKNDKRALLASFHEFYLRWRSSVSNSSTEYAVDAFLSSCDFFTKLKEC